ncbi:MAG: hypothetical protein ACKOW9_01920 [Candidatus Paceibacterota bacterium]
MRSTSILLSTLLPLTLLTSCSSATPREQLLDQFINTSTKAEITGAAIKVLWPGEPDADILIDKDGDVYGQSAYGNWIISKSHMYTTDIGALSTLQQQAAHRLGYTTKLTWYKFMKMPKLNAKQRVQEFLNPAFHAAASSEDITLQNANTFSYTSNYGGVNLTFTAKSDNGLIKEIVGVSNEKTPQSVLFQVDNIGKTVEKPENFIDVATFEDDSQYFTQNARKQASDTLAFLHWFALHQSENYKKEPSTAQLKKAIHNNVPKGNITVTVVGSSLEGLYRSKHNNKTLTFCSKYSPTERSVNIHKGECKDLNEK